MPCCPRDAWPAPQQRLQQALPPRSADLQVGTPLSLVKLTPPRVVGIFLQSHRADLKVGATRRQPVAVLQIQNQTDPLREAPDHCKARRVLLSMRMLAGGTGS